MKNMHSTKQQAGAPWGRIVGGLGGLLALTCSVAAPLPLAIRVAAFGTSGAYLLLSAIAGRWTLSRCINPTTEREHGP